MKLVLGINFPCVKHTYTNDSLFIVIMGQAQKYRMGWTQLLGKILHYLKLSLKLVHINRYVPSLLQR